MRGWAVKGELLSLHVLLFDCRIRLVYVTIVTLLTYHTVLGCIVLFSLHFCPCMSLLVHTALTLTHKNEVPLYFVSKGSQMHYLYFSCILFGYLQHKRIL